MEEWQTVVLLIGLVLTVLMAIGKVAVPLALAWIWVFMPLIVAVVLAGGLLVFLGDGDIF